MKANTKHGIRYKEYKKEDGGLIKYGYNSEGDVIYIKYPDFAEAWFDAKTGVITKIIKDNKVFKPKSMTDDDTGNYISLSNEKNNSEIYTFFRPYLVDDKLHWTEIRYENNGKIMRIVEVYPNGSESKCIDYENENTCLFFPNRKKHVCIFSDETFVFDYTDKLVYRIKNGVINKYNKDGIIIKSMYEENENKIYTYPAICSGADIRCVKYPSGLEYWYRNDKLIMKKYAKGTIYMYSKKAKKDKIKYKIMVDGTKIFYNQRGNLSYEVKPNGKIIKYRGGRKVNN